MGEAPTLTSEWTTVDGLSVHALRSIARPRHPSPTVALVHGLGVSSRYMAPFATELAPFFPVMAPDLPGFGRSEHPRAVLDVPSLGRALAAWIEASRVRPVSLFGSSAGSQVVAACAARFPRHARSLVLQGPTVEPGERTHREQVRRWWQNNLQTVAPLRKISISSLLVRASRRPSSTSRAQYAASNIK